MDYKPNTITVVLDPDNQGRVVEVTNEPYGKCVRRYTTEYLLDQHGCRQADEEPLTYIQAEDRVKELNLFVETEIGYFLHCNGCGYWESMAPGLASVPNKEVGKSHECQFGWLDTQIRELGDRD